ncbi:MAG: type II toxin-antitoxin system RelE/ParE family toxin [Planctomycetales bacterium]|nr:type II toxin-antitoxin system RelE/ParE family toxin [Planctomycetales bacterium]
MGRTTRFHPLFSDDLTQAADWYESRTPGLGVDFTGKLESALDALIQDPERRSLERFDLRYWPLNRFPHVIL